MPIFEFAKVSPTTELRVSYKILVFLGVEGEVGSFDVVKEEFHLISVNQDSGMIPLVGTEKSLRFGREKIIGGSCCPLGFQTFWYGTVIENLVFWKLFVGIVLRFIKAEKYPRVPAF